jgi:hypothetical protein
MIFPPTNALLRIASNGWAKNDVGLDSIEHFDQHTSHRTKVISYFFDSRRALESLLNQIRAILLRIQHCHNLHATEFFDKEFTESPSHL